MLQQVGCAWQHDPRRVAKYIVWLKNGLHTCMRLLGWRRRCLRIVFWVEKLKCSKCLGNGHKANECVADWRCRICGVLGHKQSECKKESFSDHGDDTSSESDMENDNKDENHVDDQENDMTNNSKEEEEKTVQNRKP